MKHKLLSVIIAAIAIISGLLVFRYFNLSRPVYSGNGADADPYAAENQTSVSVSVDENDQNSDQVSSSGSSASAENPDQKSSSDGEISSSTEIYTGKEGLINYLHARGRKINPNSCVSAGEDITVKFDFADTIAVNTEEDYYNAYSEPLTFNVNPTFEVQKKLPDTLSANAREKIANYGIAEVDDQGNILNGYSCLIVDISVTNDSKKDYDGLLWGDLWLRVGMSSNYTGEVIAVSDDRGFSKSYFQESIPSGETIEKKIVFLPPDECVNNHLLWLEINPSGTVGGSRDLNGYVVLN